MKKFACGLLALCLAVGCGGEAKKDDKKPVTPAPKADAAKADAAKADAPKEDAPKEDKKE